MVVKQFTYIGTKPIIKYKVEDTYFHFKHEKKEMDDNISFKLYEFSSGLLVVIWV